MPWRLFYSQYEECKGSALFLILIAVVLFAALTYAITQSNRGDGASASRDSAKTIATQLVNYAQILENVTNKLLIQGCTDTEISFENDFVSGYTNPNAPANKKCHVFDIAGGGVSVQKPPPNMNDGSDYYFTGRTSAVYVGTSGPAGWCGASSCTDLVFFLPRINESTCRAINEMHGSRNIPLEDNGPSYLDNASKFTGVYIGAGGAYDINNSLTPGKYFYFGCTQGTITGYPGMQGYHFWYILIAR